MYWAHYFYTTRARFTSIMVFELYEIVIYYVLNNSDSTSIYGNLNKFVACIRGKLNIPFVCRIIRIIRACNFGGLIVEQSLHQKGKPPLQLGLFILARSLRCKLGIFEGARLFFKTLIVVF